MTFKSLLQKFNETNTPSIGSWVILSGIPKSSSETVLCRCKCGLEKHVHLNSLLYSKNRSCMSCSQVKHNHSNSEHYSRWKHMLSRCYNTNDPRYNSYGGRGIKVCESWRQSVSSYIADIGEPPSKSHELDRINNDGDYEPSNVRWVTSTVNNRNSSRTRQDGMHCIFPKKLKSGSMSFKVNVMLNGKYFPQLSFKSLEEAKAYRDSLINPQ